MSEWKQVCPAQSESSKNICGCSTFKGENWCRTHLKSQNHKNMLDMDGDGPVDPEDMTPTLRKSFEFEIRGGKLYRRRKSAPSEKRERPNKLSELSSEPLKKRPLREEPVIKDYGVFGPKKEFSVAQSIFDRRIWFIKFSPDEFMEKSSHILASFPDLHGFSSKQESTLMVWPTEDIPLVKILSVLN